MAKKPTKKQLKAVGEAMEKLVDDGYAPTATALSEAVGFDVSEDVASQIAERLYPTEKGSEQGMAGIPETTLKAAVGVARVLTERDGQEPKGDYLLQKCGQKHVDAVEKAGVTPDVVAAWACAEARRRGHANGV